MDIILGSLIGAVAGSIVIVLFACAIRIAGFILDL